MTPSVSVIIPVYQVEPFFERCLRSLFGQTLPSLEYLFVDDASPDGSIALLEKVLAEYPHRREQVRLIRHSENRGNAFSRDEAMRLAQGAYVIHCDADDWLERHAYETLYQAALRHDADVVCCGFLWETPSGSYPWHYPERLWNRMAEGSDPVVFGSAYPWNKLVRRSLYLDHDVYPYRELSVWVDKSFINPLLHFSRRTLILPEALYHYNRLNQRSMTAFKPSNVDSGIRCLEYLDRFFREQGVYEHYRLPLAFEKMVAKNDLLIRRRFRDLKRWRSTFPEANACLWQLPNYPFNQKIIDWLILHRMAWLGCALLDLKLLLTGKIAHC